MTYSIPNAQQLFDIFRPRSDVYAIWKSGHPVPARQDGQDQPLGLSAVEAHLRGQALIGFYSTNRDDTCTWAAIDVDDHPKATSDAQALVKALQVSGFMPLLERSKSGKGYHVWLLLDGEVPAYKLRLFLLDIVNNQSGINTTGQLKRERAFDRIFPNQDSVKGGYGNLLAVPFWGAAVKQGNSLFVDPDTLQPYPDQVGLLQSAARATESQIDAYLQQNRLGHWAQTVARRRDVHRERGYHHDQLGEIADIEHCEFVQYANEHRQTLPEPLWWALANNLAPFGEEGRELFHALSEGYPTYTPSEADIKFDESVKRLEAGKTPIGCHKLQELGFTCSQLDTCPARVVANYPMVYRNIPMTQTEMQEYTHVVATESDTSSLFRRFALGWHQLESNDQEALVAQVMDSRGLTKDRDRHELVRRLKAVTRESLPESAFLPYIRDYYPNAPGPEDLCLPPNYVIRDHKLYIIRTKDKGTAGTEELVAEQVLIMIATGHDYDRAEEATRTLAFRDARGEWEIVQVSRPESSDGRSLHKALGKSSFNLSSDQGPGIARYLREFEAVNQSRLLPKLTTTHLGWVRTDGDWHYVPYSPAVTLVARGAGDYALTRPETFATHGAMGEWLRLFTLLQDFPVATFILVAALTPPLMPALGSAAQSHTVAITGPRGTGKSALQYIAATAYGNPKVLLRSWDATDVGFTESLAIRRHLPALYQDLQNASNEQVNNLVYKIFNEAGRERGAPKGGTQRTADFETIMIASAETDIRTKALFAGFLRRSLVVTDPVFRDRDANTIAGMVADYLKIAEMHQGSLGRDWIAYIHDLLVDTDQLEGLTRRFQDMTTRLAQTARERGLDGPDVSTLARLMAHHRLTAALLEQRYALQGLTTALDQVWLGILTSAQENDLSRKYMMQALEWAAQEEHGSFASEQDPPKRSGLIGADYVAFFREALEQKLREVNRDPNLELTPILQEWAERDWIQRPKGSGYTVDIRIGTKTRVKMVKVLVGAADLPEVFKLDEVPETKQRRVVVSLPPRDFPTPR